MGKQTHILCLSLVFQAVMGYGLKLRGLQSDLYVFFKQGSVFQICGRTSSKRTCVRGGVSTQLCTVPPWEHWVNCGWGRSFGALRYRTALWEFFVIHWQDKHHGKQCLSQHICLVWFIIRLASFSCLLSCFDLFCFNACRYIFAEPATMASEVT